MKLSIISLAVAVLLCLYPPRNSVRTTYLIHHTDGLQHLVGVDSQEWGHFWVWNPPKPETITEYNPKTGELHKYIYSSGVDKSLLAIYLAVTLGFGFALAFLVHRRQAQELAEQQR